MKWVDNIINAEDKINRRAEAKKLRQQIVNDITSLLLHAAPELRKGRTRYWTAPLNKYAYFYLSMEFPKWIQVDNDSFKMYYAIEHVNNPPSESMEVLSGHYIAFPYKLHKTALGLSGRSVNRIRWELLREGRNIFYGDAEQIAYTTGMLMPVAIGQITDSLQKAKEKYSHNDKVPPTLPEILHKN
jgi:hypothetical protein